MEAHERDFYRDMALFSSGMGFADLELRPLSLCSRRAMEMMGLRLFDIQAELSVEEESREMALYLWLHHADLAEVCEALWTSQWETVAEKAGPLPLLVDEFRAWRVRMMILLDACRIKIRPRPKKPGAKDETPTDILEPSLLAWTVGRIAHYTGLNPTFVKWELYLPEAMQYYHAALRWEGTWTVRPGETITEEQAGDRAPDWLQPPPEPPPVDTPPSQ